MMKKDLVSEKRFSLEEALRVLDGSIGQTESSIKANTDIVNLKSEHLEKFRSESIGIQAKIKRYRSVILKYIAHVYSEGNTVYGNSGAVDIVQSLILSE